MSAEYAALCKDKILQLQVHATSSQNSTEIMCRLASRGAERMQRSHSYKSDVFERGVLLRLSLPLRVVTERLRCIHVYTAACQSLQRGAVGERATTLTADP